jgi:hypothetical protein
MINFLTKAVGAFIAVGLLAGCSQDIQANSSTGGEIFISSLGQLISKPSVDFQAASSPDVLAASADYVFTGKILEVTGTRKWVSKNLNLTVRETTVLKIRIQEVLVGSEKVGNVVFVEVLFKTAKSLSQLSDLLRESSVGVFATNARFETSADRIDQDFHLSPDTQLLSSLGPQGFVIEVPGGKEIIWPVLMDAETGLLQDAMPGGAAIPSE